MKQLSFLLALLFATAPVLATGDAIDLTADIAAVSQPQEKPTFASRIKSAVAKTSDFAKAAIAVGFVGMIMVLRFGLSRTEPVRQEIPRVVPPVVPVDDGIIPPPPAPEPEVAPAVEDVPPAPAAEEERFIFAEDAPAPQPVPAAPQPRTHWVNVKNANYNAVNSVCERARDFWNYLGSRVRNEHAAMARADLEGVD